MAVVYNDACAAIVPTKYLESGKYTHLTENVEVQNPSVPSRHVFNTPSLIKRGLGGVRGAGCFLPGL